MRVWISIKNKQFGLLTFSLVIWMFECSNSSFCLQTRALECQGNRHCPNLSNKSIYN